MKCQTKFKNRLNFLKILKENSENLEKGMSGNNTQVFDNCYRHVILEKLWNQEPNDLELNYAHILQTYLDSGNTNDFGLHNTNKRSKKIP
ncbi:hypothetical protein RclHR1_06410014 [Rhizophagus clarus]|uniref:Uncharacterized protein n=1 Tax=Rhizophagus clarus TaxID=94130 RepID=A0A2Z6SIE6_9GLOM|nr:hypothetical protein RclHR1_06410014 [Rhizophagus clarus]